MNRPTRFSALTNPGARQTGFTLIEIMIVVAIVAILAAVAYPSYTDSIRKGKRAEARAAVMNLLQQQERYQSQMNTYLAFPRGATVIPTTTTTLPFKSYSAIDGPAAKSSHLLGARDCQPVGTVIPPIKDCVEVFAQPQAGIFTDLQVTTIAIDTQGRRICAGSAVDRCWK